MQKGDEHHVSAARDVRRRFCFFSWFFNHPNKETQKNALGALLLEFLVVLLGVS